jgi:hypothetical protein
MPDEDDKLVVYFKGAKKGLVLNVTNANMIAEIVGTEEMDEWAGKQIVLYPARVDFKGKRVPAVRVDYPTANNNKPAVPAAAPPPSPAAYDPDDDVPFMFIFATAGSLFSLISMTI